MSKLSWYTKMNHVFPEWRISSVFLVFLILAWVLVPQFGNLDNILTIMVHMAPVGIIAMGMTLVITTGGIDLSVGSLVSLISVLAVGPTGEYPTSQIILIGLFAGLLCGVINGFFISYAMLSPFIVTLSSMAMGRGLALWYSDTQERVVMDPAFAFVGSGEVLGVPVPVWLLLLVTIVAHVLLSNTVLGRRITAVGSNPIASREMGIPVSKVLFFVYLFTGLLCGIAALILSSRLNISTPTFGEFYELDAIAAVIIGGTLLTGGHGTILGTFIGILIFGMITNVLNLTGASPHMQRIAKGLIILIAVVMQSSHIIEYFKRLLKPKTQVAGS